MGDTGAMFLLKMCLRGLSWALRLKWNEVHDYSSAFAAVELARTPRIVKEVIMHK